MMSIAESSCFREDLNRFVEWYALALNRAVEGRASNLKTHPNEILDNPERFGQMTAREVGEAYPDALREAILQDYQRMVRGRSLVQLLLRQLSRPGRPARHNYNSLLETWVAAKGPLFSAICNRAAQYFQGQEAVA
jgi:hypothetical protein